MKKGIETKKNIRINEKIVMIMALIVSFLGIHILSVRAVDQYPSYIVLPASLTSLGGESFAGCANATDIYFPQTVTYIGDFPLDISHVRVHCVYNSYAWNYFYDNYPESIDNLIPWDGNKPTGSTLTISGTVYDEDYMPVSGIRVMVMNASDANDVYYTTTDSNGCWNLKLFDATTYRITYSHSSYEVASTQKAFKTYDGLTLFATAQKTEPYTYEALENGTCRISVYSGPKVTTLEIPAQGPDGCTVTEIGPMNKVSGTMESDRYKKVIIPSTVKAIRRGAFRFSSEITEVVFPEGLDTIEEWAFGSDHLTKVTLPDSITTMGSEAFYYCTNLMEINYPRNLTTVLQNIGSPTSPFETENPLKSIVVPEGVTELPENVFTNYKGETVYLPSTLESISNAFYASDIKHITIPDKVVSIGGEAFRWCDELEFITLPKTLETIGNDAFDYCIKLRNLRIPGNVRSIGNSALTRLNEVKVLYFPQSLKSLEEYVFTNNPGLTDVYLPGGIETFETSAIHNYPHLDEGRTRIHTISDSIVWNYITSSYPSIANYLIPWGGTSLSGSIIDADGLSVTDVTVRIYDDSSMTVPIATVLTGSDGNWYWDDAGNNNVYYVLYEKGNYTFSQNCLSVTTSEGINYLPDVVAVNDSAQSIQGVIKTASGVPVSGVYVILYNSEDVTLPVDVVRSNGLGEWIFTEIDDQTQYVINFYSDLFTFTPESADAVPGCTINTIAAARTFEQLAGAVFDIRQNGESAAEIQVGTTVTFEVPAEGMTSVQLVVDGIAYEEVPVNDGYAAFDRLISQAGSRTIHFLYRLDGNVVGKSQPKTLSVYGLGFLDSPVINVDSAGVAGRNYTFSWLPVEHAEQYTVYMYHNSFLLYVKKIDAPSTELTIPGNYLYEKGTYSLEVIATGENYSQKSGFAEITVYGNPFAGSIEGLVKDENGAALSDAAVILLKKIQLGHVFLASAKTDGEGSFSFGQLPSDCDYSIVYGKAGYEFDPVQLDVISGRNNLVIAGASLGDGPLYLSEKGITHWNEANSQTVTVYSPSSWNAVSNDADWFSFTKNGNELTVTMPKNDSGNDRQGSITITAANYSVVLPVSQLSGDSMDYAYKTVSNGAQNQIVLKKGEAQEDLNFLFGKGAVKARLFGLFGGLFGYYSNNNDIQKYYDILVGDTKKMTDEEIIKAKKEFITKAETSILLLSSEGRLTQSQRVYCVDTISHYIDEDYMTPEGLKGFIDTLSSTYDFMTTGDPSAFSGGPDWMDAETYSTIGASLALVNDASLRVTAQYLLSRIHPIGEDSQSKMYSSMISDGYKASYEKFLFRLSDEYMNNLCSIINQYKNDVGAN